MFFQMIYNRDIFTENSQYFIYLIFPFFKFVSLEQKYAIFDEKFKPTSSFHQIFQKMSCVVLTEISTSLICLCVCIAAISVSYKLPLVCCTYVFHINMKTCYDAVFLYDNKRAYINEKKRFIFNGRCM